MKKVVLKNNPLNLTKETPEERLNRIHNSNLRTRVVANKKGKGSYHRGKFKKGLPM